MSHKATDWAWTTAVRGTRQHVLLALAERANVRTRQCNPSLPELEAQTGLGQSTIRGHLRALEAAGLITVKVTNGGRRKRSTYTLMVGSSASSRPETPQELVGMQDETPQDLVGNTPQELRGSGPETPQELATNPPGAGGVVLRTKTRTREPGTATDADASASESDSGLFPEPQKTSADLTVINGEGGEIATLTAGDAVARWVDRYSECFDAKPTSQQRGQVARESRQLIEAGNPPTRVCFAAESAAAKGYSTVNKEYRQLAQRQNQHDRRASTTDNRVMAALALAATYETRESG